MSERQLATIRRIAEVKPIENADAIEAVRVDGWWVVDSIGKYELNQLVIYMEPDSWVPTEIAPFLTKAGHEPKEFEGVKGERLRTIKLRGQISQGLLLPITDELVDKFVDSDFDEGQEITEFFFEGNDLTEFLNIKKYEKPLHPSLTGLARGNFPSFIPKTDQPRIQNLGRNLEVWNSKGYTFEITEKVDGSSMTVYRKDDHIGVCSRNLELKEDSGNAFWEAAIRLGLIEKLQSYPKNLALQGELYGASIQGNQYGNTLTDFVLFDIYDIDEQRYLDANERLIYCVMKDIKHAPVISSGSFLNCTVDELLEMAEGDSLVGTKQSTREGLVFKCIDDPSISFKAISNKWLMKYE